MFRHTKEILALANY